MISLKDYIQVFSEFCYSHPDIAHRDDTNPSFFLSADKLVSTVKTKDRTGEYLFLLLPPKGRFEYDSELYNVTTGEFLILKKGGDISQEALINTIHAETEALGMFLTGWLNDLYERSPFSGPVAGYDINSVAFDYVGPLYGGYYGVQFRFTLKTIPLNIYDDAGRATLLQAGLTLLPATNYPGLFKSFAYAHPDIAHRDDTNPSYFTDALQQSASLVTLGRSSEFLLYTGKPTGRLLYGSELYSILNGSYMILCKGGDISEETRNKGIQSKALEIGMTLAAWMYDLYLESPYNGVLPGFDLNSVTWELTRQEEGNYYGASFSYSCKTIPYDIYDSEGRNDKIKEGLSHRYFAEEFAIEFE